MKELKLLLACGVLFGMTFGLAACDVEEDDCADGEVCDDAGAGGEGGEGGGVVEAEYSYIIIVDDSQVENMQGTPGSDFCGITANCGGDDLTGDDASVILGSGLVCDGTTTEAPCESGTDRGNAAAALDTGANCEPGSSPSDYVSIGVAGQLAVAFGVDLQGCDIVITELEGNDDEPYGVYLCQTEVLEAETCINMGDQVAASEAAGGPVSFTAPTAE